MIHRFRCWLLCLPVMMLAHMLLADQVRMSNGDVLNGSVRSLDGKVLVLVSETLGELKLPRGSVAQIVLGDVPATAPLPNRNDRTVPKGTAANVSDPVSQLRREGLNANTLEELTAKFPLLASPEVQKYFGQKVGGLISGSLNVQDIRKDAIQAVEQANELKRGLGPEAAQALDAYLGILEAFIDESAPNSEVPDNEGANQRSSRP